MNRPLILVAEDEELMRAILTRLLEEAGYRTLAVANAEEALERFAAEDVAMSR
jgi:CheY-like chemotaxis protein